MSVPQPADRKEALARDMTREMGKATRAARRLDRCSRCCDHDRVKVPYRCRLAEQ